MIKFELIVPGCSQENINAVMYLQGQSYVMFNKLQIKLDCVLNANEDWVCCYLDPGLSQSIHFMKRDPVSGSMVLAQTAKIVSTTTSEMANDADGPDDEHKKKLLMMRLKQAATSHRAAKHASEMIRKISRSADDSDDEHEKRLSTMRLKQAATVHRAVKYASEVIREISNMIKSFDHRMEQQFAREEGAKLGILEHIRKCRGAVSLNAMEYTLKMMEDESVAIMHEELDIPPLKRQRLHY